MIKINYYYPLGREKKTLSPLNIDVSGLNLAGFTIECRTNTKRGSEVYIYYNDQKIDHYTYSREMFPVYQTEMACDIYQTISSKLPKDYFYLDVSKLFEITPLIIEKCEFHQGIHIPQYNYEVLVTFY